MGWYSDKACTQKVEIGTDGLPVSGVVSDLDLYARPRTFVLKTGSEFNSLIPKENNKYDWSLITKIIFTDKIAPENADLIDVDADGDGAVVAWLDQTTFYISSQIPGQKIIANSDCSNMFNSDRVCEDYLSCIEEFDFTNLDTQNCTDMSYMFAYNRSDGIKIDCSGFDTKNVVTMAYMFCDCTYASYINVSGFNTSKVTSMEAMFYNCQSINSLNVSNFNTSNVTDMSWMFRANQLTSIDVSNFDTSNVKNMGGMFNTSYNLTELDLSNFDTNSCTDMSGMFINCEKLTTLTCPFDTSKVTNMYGMFSILPKLKELDLSTFNTSSCTSMDSIFENSNNLTRLSIGADFKFVGKKYKLPRGTWYSSNDTAYTSDGTTCTIPNNKADTYTRK